MRTFNRQLLFMLFGVNVVSGVDAFVVNYPDRIERRRISYDVVSQKYLEPLMVATTEDDTSGPLLDDVSDSNNRNGESSYHAMHKQRRLFLRNLVLSTTGTAAASAATGLSSAARAADKFLVATPPSSSDVSWPLGKVAFSLLPLAGTSTRRATVEECVVTDTIWTHDQIQGVVNVNVPVRQTVVKLSDGGLWVHNPVAPTPQLLRMMERLIELHGPVRHIVLGTVALEHKATFGDFASHYPKATVWIQPGQWSFPVDAGIEFYGLRQRGPRLREIPVLDANNQLVEPVSKQYRYYAERDGQIPEWIADFDYEVLGPFKFQSVGGFSETAFYHKSSKSLIVTDTVVSVSESPPPIIEEDPRALLFHSRDTISDTVQDTPATRKKGWRRMVQFGLVFFPSRITVVPSVAQAFDEAKRVPPELRNLGDGAIPGGPLYPWSWDENDADLVNFEAISKGGRLFCPPILTKLILDREPTATLAWVDRVSRRFKGMQRIIPCHLNNAVRVRGSAEFYEAFAPLRSQPGKVIPQRPLAEDLALLQKASDELTKLGIVAPSQICDGEEARFRGRFAS